MQIALIGWQGSGKSTLFQALTGSAPSIGDEAHRGTAQVPDHVLDELHNLYPPAKKVNARVDYLDVVGLAASQKRAGIKRSLVNHLQGANVLAVILGVFHHTGKSIPSLADIVRNELADLEIEMLLSDMQIAETRLEKVRASKQRGISVDEYELSALEKAVKLLNDERPLRQLELNSSEEKAIRGLGFLTQKPLLVIVNHGEEQDRSALLEELVDLGSEDKRLELLNASLEAEIASLDEEDRELFLGEMGLEIAASDLVIRSGFELLGLIRFFTVGDDEVRAWPVKRGSDAVEAAGTIHSDLAKGFIRAEVVTSRDLLELGSLTACRDKGLLRLEGKQYIVEDGDVMHIRFNV